MKMMKFVPYLPKLEPYQDEIALKIKKNIAENWINHKAPACREFSEKLSEFLDKRKVLLVHSDTAALDTVALLLQQKFPNNRIYYIIPATAFIADLTIPLRNNGIPVLIDVDISNGIMPTLEQVENTYLRIKSYDPEGKVVYLAVYTGANLGKNTDEVFKFCREVGILIVEDCAHVFGAKYPDGSIAGVKGDISTFSFHAAKVLNIGEGGAITFSPKLEDFYEEAKLIVQNYGMDSSWERYPHAIGHNYRMPMPQCAVGSILMDHIDEMLELRKEIAKRYDKVVKEVLEPLGVYPLHKYIWGENGLNKIGIYKYIVFVNGKTLSYDANRKIAEKMGNYLVAKCNGLDLSHFIWETLYGYNRISKRLPRWMKDNLAIGWYLSDPTFNQTELYVRNHFCFPLYNDKNLINFIPEIVEKFAKVIKPYIER